MHEVSTLKKNALALLKNTEPFSFLSNTMQKLIVNNSALEYYPKESYVIREGTPSKQLLYVIIDGQAKAITSIGSEKTVTAVRNAGDFFGITVLLTDEPYPMSVVASEDLTCLKLDRKMFKTALADNDQFSDYITEALAKRLKELYQAVTDNHHEQRLNKQSLRQRISHLAREKVITSLPMDKITSVAKKMTENNVSSVVITAFNGKPVGIITEKDLVSKVLASSELNLNQKAHEIMSPKLITVSPDDFSYQALLMMTKHNIQHVVVTDKSEVLRGIVTVKDLIRTSNSGTISIVKQIEHQDTTAGLTDLVRDIDQVGLALLDERALASEICALTNELYERITRKVIQIAENEMAANGYGAPPLRYCFINMGSAGRKEQFTRTDQDNGIIFEDPLKEEAENAANYFLALGKLIVSGLEACGFKRCTGGVMADNPQWCMPLSLWKNNIKYWVDKLDPKDIRNMTIFLDYRHIYGDTMLFENLKEYSTRLYKNAQHALLFMAEDDLKHRVPLNLFRQIITVKKGRNYNKLNLKNAVMVHLVDCLRLFSLREGIWETNSFERIYSLRDRNIFKKDDAEYIEAAYESLLMFRIRDAFAKMKEGREPDNMIKLKNLSKKELALLKESMLIVSRLQSLTSHAFRVHKA
jgi:CBS domain-containing protein